MNKIDTFEIIVDDDVIIIEEDIILDEEIIHKEPQPQPQRIRYDWATYLKEEAKEKLATTKPFTFRSFNYVWDEDDELYYHFYEIEVWKKNKIGEKPRGYTIK